MVPRGGHSAIIARALGSNLFQPVEHRANVDRDLGAPDADSNVNGVGDCWGGDAVIIGSTTRTSRIDGILCPRRVNFLDPRVGVGASTALAPRASSQLDSIMQDYDAILRQFHKRAMVSLCLLSVGGRIAIVSDGTRRGGIPRPLVFLETTLRRRWSLLPP
jgi:hypothetical protein